MPTRLTPYIRQRIVNLSKHKKRIKDIQITLQQEDDCVTTRQSISRIIKKYHEHHTIYDLLRPGRRKTWTFEHYDFLDKKMEEDDECTSYDMQKHFMEKYGIEFSTTAIRVRRKKLGWQKSGPKYCQVVREQNQVKRLEFSRRCLEMNDNFEDVIFTDESTIELSSTGRISFHRKGELAKLKPKPKHPYKVHVWAGISKRGPTSICIFSGIMRKEFFTNTILKKYLLPFVQHVYPDGHRFQQDNDPKHTSNMAKNFLIENNILHWETPAESPDLNPIEMLWNEMKYHLRKRVKPRTKDELVNGIVSFWRTVDWMKCTKYIDHLHKVLPIVVQREGKPSGH